MRLRHSVPPVQYIAIEDLWELVVVQLSSLSARGVPSLTPGTAGLFTFLYFHLITSRTISCFSSTAHSDFMIVHYTVKVYCFHIECYRSLLTQHSEQLVKLCLGITILLFCLFCICPHWFSAISRMRNAGYFSNLRYMACIQNRPATCMTGAHASFDLAPQNMILCSDSSNVIGVGTRGAPGASFQSVPYMFCTTK